MFGRAFCFNPRLSIKEARSRRSAATNDATTRRAQHRTELHAACACSWPHSRIENSERATGFEPADDSLEGCCLTPWPRPQSQARGDSLGSPTQDNVVAHSTACANWPLRLAPGLCPSTPGCDCGLRRGRVLPQLLVLRAEMLEGGVGVGLACMSHAVHGESEAPAQEHDRGRRKALGSRPHFPGDARR